MNRSLLVAFGAVSFLLSACGPPPATCTPANCFGCCDAAGACQTGASDLACGLGGQACGACTLGTSCQANACRPGFVGNGGGGGATTGGGGGTTGGGAASGGGGATGGGTTGGGTTGGGTTGGGTTGGGTTGGGTGGGATGGGGPQTGTFTVTGTVTYDFVPATYSVASDTGTLNFAASTQRPVRNAQVRVLEGTAVLAMTNTSNTGTYSLTFTATGAGALTVQVLARTSTPAITIQDNTANNAIWAIGANVPTGGGTLNMRATHGWTGSSYSPTQRTAAPFAILDSMYGAASAFLAVRPTLSFPLLRVNWSPNNTTDTNGPFEQGFIGTSYFQDGEIWIVGKDGVDTDEYDNHVIVHEWGHYFEAALSRSDSLGGNHTSGDILDPRDAFSEGWGNAAAGMLTGDPLYVDTYFTGTGGNIDAFGWDAETDSNPTDDPSPGSFSESTVMRVLYDAWDSTNEGGFDTATVGLGPICDAFTTGHRTNDAFTTIASLMSTLKVQSGVNATSINTLLAHYNVGAVTTAFGDGDPPLRAMFVTATLPLNQTVMLNGREDYNFASQNKYFVVTGNGARITVTANSSRDVGIGAYRQGAEVGYSDNGVSGSESFNFMSTNGAVYMINLVGYGTFNGNYSSTISITSP